MPRKTTWIVIAAMYVLVAAVLILGVTNLPAEAQSAATSTPQASATVNGGSATWTLLSRTFTSQYPKGFTFTIQATSNAGDIESAGVFWSHAPGNQRRRPATYDATTKTWTAVWAAAPTDAVPAWVGVDYWFVLTDVKGNTYQTDKQHTEYADTTKAWGRAESDDIIVFWEKPLPDSIGQMTLDAMAKTRELYRRAWGRLLSYKPRAILYKDVQSFSEWAPGQGNEQSILGQTAAAWGGTVQRNSGFGLEDFAYGTVTHEVGHLYQFDLHMVADSWWIEGDATFFEYHQQYDYEAHARQLASDPRFPTLHDGYSTTGNTARDGYDVGYSFIKYLTDTYGLDTHKKILDNLIGGKTLFDSIEAATGKSIGDVEFGFRKWLGMKDPTVPTPIPTEELLFPPTPDYSVTATP